MATNKKQNDVEEEDFDIMLWDHNEEQKSWFSVWKRQLKIMLNKNIILQVCIIKISPYLCIQ